MTENGKLPREFYAADGLTLARIGKTLVHRTEDTELCGIIAETEAYMGVTDKASHAYGGRMTERTRTMYLCGGYAYVYRIYGMYSCMNITASVSGSAEAVLIRALLPTHGTAQMYANFRQKSRRKNLPQTAEELTRAELFRCTDGPGKLCLAMAIGQDENRADLLGERLFVRDDGWEAQQILTSPRIGIAYAEEAALYPWRFTAARQNGIPAFIR